MAAGVCAAIFSVGRGGGRFASRDDTHHQRAWLDAHDGDRGGGGSDSDDAGSCGGTVAATTVCSLAHPHAHRAWLPAHSRPPTPSLSWRVVDHDWFHGHRCRHSHSPSVATAGVLWGAPACAPPPPPPRHRRQKWPRSKGEPPPKLSRRYGCRRGRGGGRPPVRAESPAPCEEVAAVAVPPTWIEGRR